MRIVAFINNGQPTIGIRRNDEVVDLAIAAPDLPNDLRALIIAGPDAFARAGEAADAAPASAWHACSELEYLPPLTNPRAILCIGRNYAEHAKEGGADVPKFPDVFMRSRTSLIGHGAPIIRPLCSETLDFEVELLAVIGKPLHHATEQEALDAVVGYSIFNDATIREYQTRTSQWTLGKNFDSTGAFGPEFVTADELPRGGVGLNLKTRLNGQVMQDGNTNDMVFPVATALRIITESMTLQPGDLLSTGTPSGVGYARTPPLWMADGDVCEVEIEGIGTLCNPVRNEEK